jgi:hypothetical protein
VTAISNRLSGDRLFKWSSTVCSGINFLLEGNSKVKSGHSVLIVACNSFSFTHGWIFFGSEGEKLKLVFHKFVLKFNKLVFGIVGINEL